MPTDDDDSQRPANIIEPNGRSWKTLKFYFHISIVVLFIQIAVLIYFSFYFAKVAGGEPEYVDSMELETENAIAISKLMFGTTVTMLIFTLFQAITGLIGIITLRTNYLYAYQVIIIMSTMISGIEVGIALCFLGSWAIFLLMIPSTSLIVQLAMYGICNKIIKLIRTANGMTEIPRFCTHTLSIIMGFINKFWHGENQFI